MRSCEDEEVEGKGFQERIKRAEGRILMRKKVDVDDMMER